MADRLRVRFGRRYRFTAAHRLHSPAFDDERNRQVYGKCNHPSGHGHNYTVTVVVEGEPDPVTGMVLNMTDLDNVAAELLDRFAFRHLDREVEAFRNRPSTGENIAAAIWEGIASGLAGKPVLLRRVEVRETRNNACLLEYVPEEGEENHG